MQLKQKITVTIALLSVAALAVFAGIVYPSVQAINDLEEKISDAKVQIEERYVQRQQIRKSLAALGEAKKKLGPLTTLAVREDRELDFINALEKVAADAGVEQSIQLETANQQALSLWEREIPLILNVSGPYPAILRYLSGVETLPYLIISQTTDVTTPVDQRGNNPEGNVDLRIQAMAYWQSKDAPAFLSAEKPTE